jgi:multiple sugar transport system ATP-binding protein
MTPVSYRRTRRFCANKISRAEGEDVAQSSVALRDVVKTFGPAQVIKGLSLSVEPGEFAVFVGPSGCGKSTLLRIIAGLEAPTSGRVFIGECDVTHVHPSKRGIAMVFQSYALYPHMTVAQNMAFGLKIRGMTAAEAKARVARAADILQLGELLERKPRALSGGQRQRAAIGRAIVREPDVFLFDEPLSNLDAALRGQMRVELARLHAQLGTTMIYVTHDQVEAMTLANKIVVLNGGRIEQVGPPLELYRRPANLFVACFIGSPTMNILDGKVAASSPSATTVDLADGPIALPFGDARLKAGEAVKIGVRPEDFRLAQANDNARGFDGKVVLVEPLGGETIAHIAVGPSTLVVKLPGETEVAAGASIRIAAEPSRIHLFDRDGAAVAPKER